MDRHGISETIRLIARKLGDDELRLIARGRFGDVFRIGPLCLKVARADDPQAVELHAEAALLRALQGDLLPAVHASGVDDDVAWVAMDFFSGPTLRRVIEQNNAKSLPLLRLVARVCRELADLNAADGVFFHGDLNPDHLIVTGDRLQAISPAARDETVDTGEHLDTRALARTLLEALYTPGSDSDDPLEQRLREWVDAPPAYAEMDQALRRLNLTET